MLRLDFAVADLALSRHADTTRRASISGVQDKVQLKRTGRRFQIVESGGDYILKPVPPLSPARLPADIPANEALTMDLAADVFGIRTADRTPKSPARKREHRCPEARRTSASDKMRGTVAQGLKSRRSRISPGR